MASLRSTTKDIQLVVESHMLGSGVGGEKDPADDDRRRCYKNSNLKCKDKRIKSGMSMVQWYRRRDSLLCSE